MKLSRTPFTFLALAGLIGLPCLPVPADSIKQSAAYNRTILMTSSTDHISPYTGAASTLTVQYAQAGGAFVTPGTQPAITSLGNGRFAIALTAAYTSTLGALDINVTASGADPSDAHDQIVATDPTVDLVAGQTAIQTGTTNNGTAIGNLNTLATTGNGVKIAPGQSTLASNFVAGPTLSQIQGGLPTDTSITADAQAGGYAALNMALPNSTATNSLNFYEAADAGNSAAVNALLGSLISGGKFTAAALSNAPTSPGASAASIAALILANPNVPLANNSSGQVSLAPSQAFSNSVAGTVAPTWYTAAPTTAQIAQAIFGYTLAGTTFSDHVVNTSSYLYGPFTVTHPTGTTQQTQFSFNNLPTVQSTITTTSSGAPITRTTTLTNQ